MSALNGMNCSIFHYGPYGSGKTHSLLGHLEFPNNIYIPPKFDTTQYTYDCFDGIEINDGIMYLAMKDIFEMI